MPKPLFITPISALAMGCAIPVGAAFVSTTAVARQDDPVNVFPVQTAHNDCPAGTQPVTCYGVVCCGVPNQGTRSRQAMHNVALRARMPAAEICSEGDKGGH